MSLQTKNLKIIVIACATLAMFVTLGQNCGRFETIPLSSEGTDSQQASGTESPLPIALLSSEQLLKSMISASGTEGLGELDNPADDLIRQVYMDRSGSLPSGQDLKLMTGPAMISVTNLASAVCAKAVDRDRALGEAQRQDRLFFREIDFSKDADAQADLGLAAAVQRLARNSWRRDATTEEIDAVLRFASEFKSQAVTNDIRETRMLAISLCTAVLSAFDAITY